MAKKGTQKKDGGDEPFVLAGDGRSKVKDHQKSKRTSSARLSIEKMIQENIDWSKKVYEQNQSIKRRLLYMVIGNYLRLALILIPLIIGAIYLPSLLGQALDQYKSVLGIDGSSESLLERVQDGEIGEVLEEIQPQ